MSFNPNGSLIISPNELKRVMGEGHLFAILDVRQPEEIKLASFENSINIPLGELIQRQGELPQENLIVVVCHHGIRSLKGAQWLKENGYDAVSLAGGLDLWAQEIDASMKRYKI